MQLTLLALSFAFLQTLFTVVKGQSSLALVFPSDPDSADDDSSSESFPTVWVEPIGTASDGSETTFIFNEIDSGDVALFGDEPTGTAAVTTSFTLIASASGFALPDIPSMSIGCSLESSESVACVYVAPIDIGGTSLATVSETGDATVFEVSISAPTQAAASENSPSFTGSISAPTQAAASGNNPSLGSSGGSAPSSTGAASGGKNGAEQVGPRFLGLIVAGLLVVVSFVL